MCCFLFFLENYDDLYHWSVECYSDFWAKFWKFSGIIFSRVYDEVSRDFAHTSSSYGCGSKMKCLFLGTLSPIFFPSLTPMGRKSLF